MEQLFPENDNISGTGGTVIPSFSTLFSQFLTKRWNSFLGSNTHGWNGWNSSLGGRYASPISFGESDENNDLIRDEYLPPIQLFHPFQSSLAEPRKLFHPENGNSSRKKGEEPMTNFVKLTCKKCGIVFLLETVEDPKEGSRARETETCRQLNILRHGETFAQHEHAGFKWSAPRGYNSKEE